MLPPHPVDQLTLQIFFNYPSLDLYHPEMPIHALLCFRRHVITLVKKRVLGRRRGYHYHRTQCKHYNGIFTPLGDMNADKNSRKPSALPYRTSVYYTCVQTAQAYALEVKLAYVATTTAGLSLTHKRATPHSGRNVLVYQSLLPTFTPCHRAMRTLDPLVDNPSRFLHHP
jgi:hypothetical protein